MTPDPEPTPASFQTEYYWAPSEPPYRRISTPATIGIVATTILVFLCQVVAEKFYDSHWFTYWLAFSPLTFSYGDYWQVLTYAWLHAVNFPIHILFNMWMVWVLGSEIERILGSLRFLAIYIGGAIGAALVFFLLARGELVSVAGASGSAFALLTTMAVLCPKRRISALLFFVIPIKMRMSTMAWIVCGTEAAFELMNWIPFLSHLAFDWLPSISHSAHLGGALFGVLAGYLFKPHPPKPQPVVFTSGYFPPDKL
jgi:membrane associated rhomboid family serine protease